MLTLPPLLRLLLALTLVGASSVLKLPWIVCIYAVTLCLLLNAGTWQAHIRFALFLSTPILLALLLVWGVAVPVEQLPAGYTNGWLYACSTWIKLLISAGALQWLLLPLLVNPRMLTHFLDAVFVRGQGQVLVLSTLAFIPEIERRARLILDARRAQSMSRSGIRALLDLPSILMPLIASLLDSANKRAELWTHRKYFEVTLRESKTSKDTNIVLTSVSPQQVIQTNTSTEVIQRFNRIQLLEGPNFSGRTKRLRQIAGLDHPEFRRRGAYIGLDAAQSFSGVASTLAGEIAMLSYSSQAKRQALALLNETEFAYCLDRNPFLLSGGEQVIAATAIAVASAPDVLSIDCATEQLAPTARIKLLRWLDDNSNAEIWLADNRLREWYVGPAAQLQREHDVLDLDLSAFEVQTDRFTGNHIQRIEVRNLGHRYGDGPFVFRGLNLQFERGQHYRIAGKNGAGKSTLAKILSGVIKPTEGDIWVDGKRFETWSQPGSLMSYHFQNPYYQMFVPRVGDLIRHNSLGTTLENTHPLDLHFVMAKRVAFLAAYLRNKSMFFCDEPYLGQDVSVARSAAKVSSNCLITALVNHSRDHSHLQNVVIGSL